MTRRLAVAGAVVATGLLFAAPAAFAHVTVQPGEAAKGSYSQLSFRVPNERDDATVEVKVQFPPDHPIADVSVEPVPGWTIKVAKTKLSEPLKNDDGDDITEAVSTVTWSGGKLEPGEYQNFSVSAGPLPEDTDSLTFKAIQTYADGQEVAWIDATPASGEEPEHPAPVLTLTAATGDEHGAKTDDATGSAVTQNPSGASKSDVDDANSRATIALVVGAIGVIAGVAGIVLGRRNPTA